MKILELKSNNIKRLKAVELQLDEKENVIMVTGKNGQGKTSILDSIWYALGGAKVAPEEPIRKGTEHAEISLDLGEYVVTRTFTEKGSYLRVENKEGARYQNPQQLLDKLVGELSFDPLAFSRLEAKKQIAGLISITGLDFSDLDAEAKKLTEERVFVGRELKAMGAVDPALVEPAVAMAAKEEINITELAKKIQEANAAIARYNIAERTIQETNDQIANLEGQIKDIQELIAKLRKDNESMALIPKNEDPIEEWQAQLNSAEQNNAAIREAKRLIAEVEAQGAKQDQYDSLTSKLEAITFARQERLAKAKMPIDGLAWTEANVTYQGIPFEQLSAAEQLKISMAMAMVANPKLRVILIRDGSLLDSDNLKVIKELAEDMDFQVWIERVDDSGKVGIYIEDGEIAKNNNAPTTTGDATEQDT